MNPDALKKIKEIQVILDVTADGQFGKKSQAALAKLISGAAPAPTPEPLPVGSEFDPRTEKNLATLHPKAVPLFREFLRRIAPVLASRGVVAKVISGTRTYAEQDELYAQGRTKPGRIVTKARGGYSNHNFGVAIDIGLFRGGDYLEDSPLYKEIAPFAKYIGLEWGGDWKSMKDEPHYEVPTGLTLAQKRARVAAHESIL